MNRQQRRARQRMSRAEWSRNLTELGKTLPPGEIGDLEVVQLLVDVIVDEQLSVSDESLAVLSGLVCTLMRRVAKTLPPATHVDAQGHPVYSLEQVAQFTGHSVAQVNALIGKMSEEADISDCIVRDPQRLQ